ncbi:hypothetical protein JHK86_012419 [Glycine max]|nr:hypothetical protein JHK86_012419 [Glycine max]
MADTDEKVEGHQKAERKCEKHQKEEGSGKWSPSSPIIGGVVLSCTIFLLLSMLFLLQVASISQSNGAKSLAEELPRIQNTNKSSNLVRLYPHLA